MWDLDLSISGCRYCWYSVKRVKISHWLIWKWRIVIELNWWWRPNWIIIIYTPCIVIGNNDNFIGTIYTQMWMHLNKKMMTINKFRINIMINLVMKTSQWIEFQHLTSESEGVASPIINILIIFIVEARKRMKQSDMPIESDFLNLPFIYRNSILIVSVNSHDFVSLYELFDRFLSLFLVEINDLKRTIWHTALSFPLSRTHTH